MYRTLILSVSLCLSLPLHAQEHGHAAPPDESTTTRQTGSPSMPGMNSSESMDHSNMDHSMAMHGMYGAYRMTREASGTSWQPDATPMEGIHSMDGPWNVMWHGFINGIYDHQGGPRGDNKAFSESMLMGMGQRPLAGGTLGLRAMVSLDPLMGKSGYPLLLQTGETANGQSPLIDRQHPHDFLMELATSYSRPLSKDTAVFAYIGLPGEPALGPPAFMHRFSGMDNPEAPLTHHWLDSTHITFGVITAGAVWHTMKLEGSVFNGREPDQNRWNIEVRKLDSASGRLSWNPTPAWSMQISHGRLDSPELLEPDISVRRTTASASYQHDFGTNRMQTTLAWGRNRKQAGENSDGWLLESALRIGERHTLFGRVERVDNNELFEEGEALHGQTFKVGKFSLGAIHDFRNFKQSKVGVGALVSFYAIPSGLEPIYGSRPTSYMLFARAQLR